MRAGVRPGLQILRVCLRWTGRFDSDTLPPELFPMARKKSRKPKRLTAVGLVKLRARTQVGAPPPVKRQEGRKKKRPKHKKRELEREAQG